MQAVASSMSTRRRPAVERRSHAPCDDSNEGKDEKDKKDKPAKTEDGGQSVKGKSDKEEKVEGKKGEKGEEETQVSDPVVMERKDTEF